MLSPTAPILTSADRAESTDGETATVRRRQGPGLQTAQLNADLAATLVLAMAGEVVHDVVISPGSRSTPLVLALAEVEGRHAALRLHVVLDERTAGFFALGLARATRRPVALVCTSGSAPAHYLPAVIEASEDCVPLVILTADRPAEQHGCGAAQTVDQQRLFAAHVRHFVDLGTPSVETGAAYAASVMARALGAASGLVPGPVHLNVPFREPLWSPGILGHAARASRAPSVACRSSFRDESGLRGAARALSGSTRPLIVCGPMAWPGDDRLGEQVLALAQRLGAPVLADATSQLRFSAALARSRALVTAGEALLQGAFGGRSPALEAPGPAGVGVLPRDGVRPGSGVLPDARVKPGVPAAGGAVALTPDAVIRLGRTPTSRTLQRFLAELPTDVTYVHADVNGSVHDPAHRADLVVTGTPGDLAGALCEHKAADPLWLDCWREADEAAHHCVARACAEGFWEGGIARAFAESVPEGEPLLVANSMSVRNLDAFAAPRDVQVPVFCNRGAAGIDGTLATALGLAAGARRRVHVLCGDLAFLHDVGTLFSARSLVDAGDATVVVVNNGGGGIFGHLQIAEHASAFERFFLTPCAADLGAIAQAAGAEYDRVRTLPALARALAAAQKHRGLSIVECVVDREVDADLRRRLADEVQRTLRPRTELFT